MRNQSILVIDDEPLMREYVEEAMTRLGYVVDSTSNGNDGIALFEKTGHDVVITDLKMTPLDGLAVIKAITNINPDTIIIVMTAYGTIETAVTALKEGAADYILKPFTPDALEVAISRALDRAQLRRENTYLRNELNAMYDCDAMVGQGPAMKKIYQQIKKVAASHATVLVRGNSGTGKELVARAIHYAGNRHDKPFVKVNCAALSAGILESELFGHEKGAFTGAVDRKFGRFELAHTGTLLLDEVSEIGAELQSKLLRALQEREFERVGGTKTIQVDTRILATSNRNLEKAVEEGTFREDLYYRLNVITIQLPPLKERRDDITSLVNHFLERFNRENGRAIQGFAPETQTMFQKYDWPGNVRELQNVVERAVVLAEDDNPLAPHHFHLSDTTQAHNGPLAISPGTTVAEMEKRLIINTLEHCNQNRTRAAELLSISVRTLRNKLKEYSGTDLPAE
jgi:DNA-binding NtrC family response regulator